MFGPPKDVEGECNARLEIGDDYGDNCSTMRCPLSPGHDGPHKEVFQRKGDVTITWHADARKEAPFQAKALVAFTTESEKLEYPAGTEVSTVEGLPPDALEPEAYIVEVSVPDETFAGGFRFDTAKLQASDLERLQ